MIFATFLGVLLIPVFYVFVRRLLGDKLEPMEETFAATKDPNVHG
jgi:multidrug efflux pump